MPSMEVAPGQAEWSLVLGLDEEVVRRAESKGAGQRGSEGERDALRTAGVRVGRNEPFRRPPGPGRPRWKPHTGMALTKML